LTGARYADNNRLEHHENQKCDHIWVDRIVIWVRLGGSAAAAVEAK
jgi:hypothetical protein